MKSLSVGKGRKIFKTPVGVFQVDIKTNIVIQKFPSVEVAKNRTGIGANSIRSCIRGDQKSAGGFRWLKEDKTKK